MSYTNSTPNLHLPQYIATDKPTYLGDWNASMQTIDTVMTATQATANGANSTATSANSTALAAQQSANTANGKADTNATAIQEVNNDLALKNITFSNVSGSNFTLGANNFQYNKYFGKFYITANISGKPTNNVTNSGSEYVAIASTVGNIFQLTTDIITGSNSKIIGNMLIINNRSSGNTTDFYIVSAYFDGANTVLYYSIDTGTFNATTPILANFFDTCTMD